MRRGPLMLPQPRHAEKGFVLPLAIGTSLVLLLGSASVHSLALHSHLRARSSWQDQERQDQLRSAAMAFLGQTNTPAQRCLMEWPLAQWPSQAAHCGANDASKLNQGQAGSHRWELLDWQPSAQGAELQLRLGGSESVSSLSLSRAPDGFQLRDGLQAVQP
ncbi:hypothetical protein [Synechococcus sp. RS9916]|uniref:hypothetical protein n=1 Tax=Synechococcus sp. RS9916 TaxID=221359 RepID=UPI000682731D|nr:hypothetical protein [Synechococcus sp. RS9916]